MNLYEIINKRRSVRKFTDEKIPEEIMKKCMSSSLLAANSSNLQPWEFYWIKNPDKKKQIVKACFSQSAARTAREIVVSVSRIDTWRRNRDLIVANFKHQEKFLPIVDKYYNKIIPLIYFNDKLGLSCMLRSICSVLINIIGIFKPVPRGPYTKSQLFESVTKTTALACQNFMMTLVAEGYDSCPMEGFDEKRVKKILGLNHNCHVVMIFGIGKADQNGIYYNRFRIDDKLVIKTI
ncbi:MAG: nitroreductase family protein [Flavobacteriales bacterium]|nr:nitroreductase family protein [Flavobacteriales bacterium]|tara:strand:- start:417 stop:1124 length:708 start_codon:yes stop_codon:yes gene_type:complete